MGTTGFPKEKINILYILDRANTGLPILSLISLSMESCMGNYFTIAQALAELRESGHVKKLTIEKEQYFLLTSKGKETLGVFRDSIPKGITNSLDESILATLANLASKKDIWSHVEKVKEHDFRVTLGATEKNTELLKLCVSVVSQAQAEIIEDNWHKNSKDILPLLIEAILNQGEKLPSKPTYLRKNPSK